MPHFLVGSECPKKINFFSIFLLDFFFPFFAKRTWFCCFVNSWWWVLNCGWWVLELVTRTKMVIVDTIFHSFQQFITNDIPSILSLTSTSLKCLPLPSSPSSFSSLSFSDWLALAPLLTLVTLFSLYLLPSLFQREEENKKKRTFWLTRICLLRMMGLIYLAAFLTSSFQSRPLFGEKGLEPSSPRSRPIPAFRFLEWALSSSSSSGVPDLHLEIVSWVGVFLSLVLITSPISTFLIPLALWLLYLSIVNLESMVIRYGWEWLTLEAGFLAIFLSPLFSFSSFPSETPPSRVVLWLYRWLAFRLLFGAGMSKLGSYSSACWKELTCTTTHHMTQPMPNLFAWFAHRAPFSFHQCEVLLTFFEQLILPFFVLIPIRSLAIFGAVMECFFQVLKTFLSEKSVFLFPFFFTSCQIIIVCDYFNRKLRLDQLHGNPSLFVSS